ncbi:hypothetical protein Tco_0506786 [Tanacetum coccineum]
MAPAHQRTLVAAETTKRTLLVCVGDVVPGDLVNGVQALWWWSRDGDEGGGGCDGGRLVVDDGAWQLVVVRIGLTHFNLASLILLSFSGQISGASSGHFRPPNVAAHTITTFIPIVGYHLPRHISSPSSPSPRHHLHATSPSPTADARHHLHPAITKKGALDKVLVAQSCSVAFHTGVGGVEMDSAFGLQLNWPRKRSSKKQWVHKESVSKQGRKLAKGEPSVHRDPLFDEIPEDTLDHMETEDAQIVGRTRDTVGEEKGRLREHYT